MNIEDALAATEAAQECAHSGGVHRTLTALLKQAAAIESADVARDLIVRTGHDTCRALGTVESFLCFFFWSC